MKRATWKRHETIWAELLGGKRVPVSGRGRGDVPDIQHPYFSVEAKSGAVLSTRLLTGMAQAKAAAKGNQTPIVCIANRSKGNVNTSGRYVLMELEGFLALMKAARIAKETERVN